MKEVLYATFGFVFTYLFLPPAILFQTVMGVELAADSVKRLHFMATGSYSIHPNVTAPYDQITSGAEFGIGAVLTLISCMGFVSYMYISSRGKAEKREGRVLPYSLDVESIPLSEQTGTFVIADEEGTGKEWTKEAFHEFIGVDD